MLILLLVHARARDSLQSSCLGVRSEAVPFYTVPSPSPCRQLIFHKFFLFLLLLLLLSYVRCIRRTSTTMQHQRLTLTAFLAVLTWLLDGQQHLALANSNGQQNYGSFSGSGLDQDGGLQPAVGGYSFHLLLLLLFIQSIRYIYKFKNAVIKIFIFLYFFCRCQKSPLADGIRRKCVFFFQVKSRVTLKYFS